MQVEQRRLQLYPPSAVDDFLFCASAAACYAFSTGLSGKKGVRGVQKGRGDRVGYLSRVVVADASGAACLPPSGLYRVDLFKKHQRVLH